VLNLPRLPSVEVRIFGCGLYVIFNRTCAVREKIPKIRR
jgi:hypothetical protein